MIKISEKLLEQKVKKAVEAKGGLSIKIYSAWFTGLPDRFNLMPGGRLILAEIKTTGEDLSPRQKVVRKLLEKLGFTYFKIDSKESLEEFIDAL